MQPGGEAVPPAPTPGQALTHTHPPSCRDKPYLLYFNIFSCALATNIITVAEHGLQCPTPQVRAWDLPLPRSPPGLERAPQHTLCPRCVCPPVQRPPGS